MTEDDGRDGDAVARLLSDQTAWLRLVCDAVTDGVVLHEQGRILRVNEALARMLGYTPEEMVGMPGTLLTVPEDRARLMRHIAAESTAPLVGTALRRDGSTFPCEVLGRTVHVDGHALRVALVRDVSARREAEREIRRRERELASITEHTPDIITRYDREHRIRYMSAGVERATGRPAAEFVGRRLDELGFPTELAARWIAINERVFGSGHPEVAEFEFQAPDGTTRYYHTQVVPERGPDGAVECVLTTTRDLTELKRAQAAAREADATLRGLVEQSLTGVYVIQDGRFVYVNPRFAEIFGYDGPEEVMRRVPVDDFVHPDDVELVREKLRQRLQEGAPAMHYRFRGRRRDGSTVHVEVYGSVGEHGGRPAVVGTLLDVTERVEARRALRASEAQLRQSQKMEALGQLAGGVAHDFNNLLAAITGYGQLVLGTLEEGDPRRADVDEILKAARRGAGVTRQLLAFSRRQALETEPVDLTDVVREVGGMLHRLLPASVSLRVPDAPPLHVRAARAQLEQIVLNLAVNARDAMPQGGTLTLAVAEGAEGAERRVTLEVRDTGVGMSPEVRAHIFDPFFTTKPTGQGTGLGLSTVYGLVRQFEGAIEVETEEGRGTTFRVSFPAVEAEGEAPAPGADGAGAPSPARRRVLLVEDEEQIRQLVRRILARHGYEVADAPNGAEALERLRRDSRFDLVLSDVAMPELGGRDLALRIAEMRPELPVVLMSGYAELAAPDGSAAIPPGIAGFVEKPFTIERLLAVVAEAVRG